MNAVQSQDTTPSRPHGGFRGIHEHPPSAFSFNKTAEYQRQLQQDLDKLLETDKHSNAASPTWVVETSKIVHHGGQSQLFNKKLLAASKLERHLEVVGMGSMSRRPSASSQRSRPPSSASNQSSRPSSISHPRKPSAHQYLTDTMLFDDGEDEQEFILGRPTRTTLLRARQRCNSAPMNSYSAHKEEFQNFSNRKNSRAQQTTTLTSGLKSKLGKDGQSLHSFLTGARYNRAHYYDAKGVSEHGLYMPRSNPHAAFLMRPSSAVSRDEEDTPPASPDSADPNEFISDPDNRPKSAAASNQPTKMDDVDDEKMPPQSISGVWRPKSCKLRQRPKPTAISIERKPFVAQKVTIELQDVDPMKCRPKSSHARIQSSSRPKSKPSPSCLQSVCVKGHSVSDGPFHVPPNKLIYSQPTRPQTGTTGKARVTARDVSHQLKKENIFFHGKQTSGQDTENNRVDEDLLCGWESQSDRDIYNVQLFETNQRSCPSPANTPRNILPSNANFQESPVQTNSNVVPVLKNSRHRIGSAKPRNSHVHFAEDVLDPEQTNTQNNVRKVDFTLLDQCESQDMNASDRDLSLEEDEQLCIESLADIQDLNVENNRPVSRIEASSDQDSFDFDDCPSDEGKTSSKMLPESEEAMEPMDNSNVNAI